MRKRITCFLDLPLQFRGESGSILRYATVFSLFIALFLSFYQPFFIAHLGGSSLWTTTVAIAAFTWLSIVVNHYLMFQAFARWTAHWTVLRELLWSMYHFLLIGCFNFLWVRYNLKLDMGTWVVLGDTAFVGLIPVAMDLGLRMRASGAKADPSELLYAMSDGNYVHIFQSQGTETSREVVRCPLYKFRDRNSAHWVQVHKRFLVNAEAIKAVKGNSNGGHIVLSDDSHVPYSRRFYLQVKKLAS